MKNIKTELWKIRICDGALDMVHGNYYAILEVYIPKYNIAFNFVGDKVNVFRPNVHGLNRYKNDNAEKICSITISGKFVLALDNYMKLEDKINSDIKEFWLADKMIQKYELAVKTLTKTLTNSVTYSTKQG